MKSLAIKRYGPLRRGRYQRSYDTPEQATAAAERWFRADDVKAVWAYGPDGNEILHKNKAEEAAR